MAKFQDQYGGYMTGMRGSDVYGDLGRFSDRNPEAATTALRNQGIPGIKYLDQGSRAAGEGTRNYVIFDDTIIDILRKYGLLPAAVAGGSLASQEPQ